MRWYERHIDASLTRWSLGDLSSHQSARLLRHAHACQRCGTRYERWAQAHRALEGNDIHVPSSVELQALSDGGLEAALAAAAPEQAPSRWSSLALLGGALAAVFLAVVLVPTATTTPGEFVARGEGTAPPGVALRIFCATPGRPCASCTPEMPAAPVPCWPSPPVDMRLSPTSPSRSAAPRKRR
ncbi:hypothetical protein QEG98_37290 [Myxococcus sp. MxC21-1]|uniref:hypothetical protein n=1 Tax=Myxococcus sp. MxC21-1 TaxID=3041439 RepID=UPI00292ECCD6|nr:hypothetical protein [Myxococcus sp. MxC21-1]WNZ61468.1 hypothetical protein QEG98_37290 [Myxococcus sp. MxC21-1]